MGNANSFRDELAAINLELTDSLARLQFLLAHKRSELSSAQSRADRAELEKTIRELERKLQEIKDIGSIGNG